MPLEKKWIWQHQNYPNFRYNKENLEPLMQEIKYHQGLLDGIYSSINNEDLAKAQIEIFTQEAMDTSEIEGQILSRDSVRSSLSNKFRLVEKGCLIQKEGTSGRSVAYDILIDLGSST